jgi:hypothetical protein
MRRFLQEPHAVNIPEDTILHSHRRENLKSYAVVEATVSDEDILTTLTNPSVQQVTSEQR